jgi:phage gp29-like protein
MAEMRPIVFRSSSDPVLQKYEQIRSRYKDSELGTFTPSTPIVSDRHGFFVGGGDSLGERFAGFDKLFLYLVRGIVDNPDYAIRKDPEIYDKMLRDPQIFYCLFVRKVATSSLPWVVRPPAGMEQDDDAIAVAKEVEQRIKKLPRFPVLLDNIMDAVLTGLSVNELCWNIVGGKYLVHSHFPVNKDRIKFYRDGSLRLLSRAAPVWGEPLPQYKFIQHTYNVTDGSWSKPETAGYAFFGRGLADTPLYHYFHFKMMALKFLMKDLEHYGMPFKIIYTGPQNAALAEKLHSIMSALRNDSVVSIPGKKGDVNVDIAQASRSMGSNVFMLFLEYVDKLITRAILGQDLMTEMPSGAGSYAMASVHRGVFDKINEKDRTLVEDTLSRTLIKFDLQLNNPGVPEEYHPQFAFKHPVVEDAAAFLQVVQAATGMGITVSESQVREFTDLKEPLPNERVIGPPIGAGMSPGEGMETDPDRMPTAPSPKNNPRGKLAAKGKQGKKPKNNANAPNKMP